jgi:hypothetical protein
MAQSKWLRVFHHPFTVAGASLILAVTGLIEVAALFLDSDATNDWGVRAAHGQALFGILLFVRTVGEGIDHFQKARGGLRDAKEALGHHGRESERAGEEGATRT